MPAGYVFLYSDRGELIQRSWYKHRERRRVLINRWRIQYGQRFNTCYLHIIPDTREDLVSIHNGKNLRKDNMRGQKTKVFKYQRCFDRWNDKYKGEKTSILIEFKKQAI